MWHVVFKLRFSCLWNSISFQICVIETQVDLTILFTIYLLLSSGLTALFLWITSGLRKHIWVWTGSVDNANWRNKVNPLFRNLMSCLLPPSSWSSYVSFTRRMIGARGSAVCWITMLQARTSRVRFPIKLNFSIDLHAVTWFETRWGKCNFSVYLILQAALGPGVYLASNRNEHQKHKIIMFLGSKERPVLGDDNLTAICVPIVRTIWDP
jgi:hypothetical protein